ncbi:TonB-dependent siderophore receptor [Pantoea cypripedii]|uniref:TonB-dependent siderophore receptor n=1 Tax=Pantoea cypripedii TaxID=55209 RepID=A0A6B9FYL3_PANCY|nr:TonB-dependent siderophore receptor [Pantoea cypripedii]QGY29934.1 TonB-dependent siderophore receptor [Pantoea cypripedii]
MCKMTGMGKGPFVLSALALTLMAFKVSAADQQMVVTASQAAPLSTDDTSVVSTSSTSATKTATPKIEVPQSVSSVTRKQMDLQAAQTTAEALRYTSGVVSEIRGASSSGAGYLFSRGFYLEQFLDGARMPSDSSFGYAIANYDTYGFSNIEVLHGPASVLYGQVNPGGVVNLTSKKPTATPVHEVFVTAGSHDHLQTGFDIGGKANDDGTLLYRLTASGTDSKTQVDDTRQKHVYVAPALTWKPNEDTSLTVLAKYQRDPDVGYYNFVPAVGSVLSTANGKISPHTNLGDPNFDHHSRTQFSVGYEFWHRLNNTLMMRQNVHYSDVKDNLENVFTNGYASGSSRVLNRYAFFNHEQAKTLSVDNQLEADFDTSAISHQLLSGVDFQRVLYRETVGLGAAPTLDAFAPDYSSVTMPNTTSDDHIRQKQLGVYTQDQMRLGNWSYLLGMREDWAHADDVNPVTDSSTEQSARAFTWRTGLVYQFDNGIAPYASFAKSFIPQVGTLYGGGMAKPTTANQYEVGVKYQPTGFSGFITTSWFDLTEKNVLTSDPQHSGYNTQAGRVRSKGVEVEAHANLTPSLTLISAYTWLNAVTIDSNDSASTLDGGTTSLEGKRLWGMPRNTASAWLDYSFHQGVMQGFGVNAGVRYIGSSEDTSNTIRVASATVMDAGIHYDTGDHWLLSLNASNLLDRHYVASCYSATTCTYAAGANVLATARYRW